MVLCEMYIKRGCPYCERALNYLNVNNVRCKVTDIGDRSYRELKIRELRSRGYGVPINSTVPIIILNNRYLPGGSEELLRLKL